MRRPVHWAHPSRFIGLFVVSLAVACATAPPAAQTGSPPVPVKVLALLPEVHERTVEGTGAIEADQSVELRPETSGVVTEVRFSDGQHVARGDVLLTLRDTDARAQLADARARRELSRVQLGRTRALFERQDASQADLDAAVAADALAEAAVTRAEEAVRKTRIVAPFAGVLGRRGAVVGAMVDATRVVARLEALDQLVVDLALPESALALVAPEQPARVTVETLPEPIVGVVRYVAPRVNASSRTIDVRVALENPGERLRPGQSAEVVIVTETVPEALLVPSEALVASARGSAVYLAGADGTAELRPVRTRDRGQAKVEVVEGLAAGDRVIVEGLARLRPKAPIVEATEKAP